MWTPPIDTLTPNTKLGAAKTASRDSADDTGAQFMQLLLTQLRNQNPLDPVQDKDFMGQVTQLNSLEELRKMTTLLQAQSKAGRLTEAASLIDRSIHYRGSDGTVQSGVVTGVSLDGDQPILLVGAAKVALTSILTVNAQEA